MMMMVMMKVMRHKLEKKREFRRLATIVAWLESLKETDLWQLQDEIAMVVRVTAY